MCVAVNMADLGMCVCGCWGMYGRNSVMCAPVYVSGCMYEENNCVGGCQPWLTLPLWEHLDFILVVTPGEVCY